MNQTLSARRSRAMVIKGAFDDQARRKSANDYSGELDSSRGMSEITECGTRVFFTIGSSVKS